MQNIQVMDSPLKNCDSLQILTGFLKTTVEQLLKRSSNVVTKAVYGYH